MPKLGYLMYTEDTVIQTTWSLFVPEWLTSPSHEVRDLYATPTAHVLMNLTKSQVMRS